MLNQIRKGLLESYKHRQVERAICIACGRTNQPLALHVIEFYHPDNIKTPSLLVAMSRSRGTTRGSVPICSSCCPPCARCSLPIATPWINKLLSALTAKYQGITFVIGNGYCRHVHVLHDFNSLFRSVKLVTSNRRDEQPQDLSDSTRDRAIDLMKSGNYRAALASLNALLEKDASDWSLLYMAGQCARFTNDVPLAVRCLKRAAQLNQTEPQLFLALGIAHQLSGQFRESEDALRKALELDADMESAYNSLGITQKKMGELDLATHNLEEGLRALSRRIARTMSNQRESSILPHPGVLGTRWTQLAINGGTYICARQTDISRFAWPTGEQAIQEARTKAHAGLFWIDSVDASGSKTRLFLPNFFNTFCACLRKEQIYVNILQNLGTVLDLRGEHSEAKACFSEAEEFLDQ